MSGVFEILNLKLAAIGERISKVNSTSNANNVERMFTETENHHLSIKLKQFMRLHVEAIDVCENLSHTFKPIIFVHFLASAFLVCASCLMLFLAKDAEKMIYFTFVVSGFADVFLLNYGGHCVIESSKSISEGAYSFCWHRCDVKNQKLILMIIMRAQKASAISIPFFPVSLETYVKVSEFEFRLS